MSRLAGFIFIGGVRLPLEEFLQNGYRTFQSSHHCGAIVCSTVIFTSLCLIPNWPFSAFLSHVYSPNWFFHLSFFQPIRTHSQFAAASFLFLTWATKMILPVNTDTDPRSHPACVEGLVYTHTHILTFCHILLMWRGSYINTNTDPVSHLASMEGLVYTHAYWPFITSCLCGGGWHIHTHTHTDPLSHPVCMEEVGIYTHILILYPTLLVWIHIIMKALVLWLSSL